MISAVNFVLESGHWSLVLFAPTISMGDVHYLPIGSILLSDNEGSIFIISTSGHHRKEL